MEPTEEVKPLSHKERRFVAEYLIDCNGTQAAIRTGYSAKSATSQASDLLRKPNIRAAIEHALAQHDVAAGRIIAELAAVAFGNMGDFINVGGDTAADVIKSLRGLPRAHAAAIQELTVETYVEGGGEDAKTVKRVKLKLTPKLPALVKLGERLGMFKVAGAGKAETKLGKKEQASRDAATAGQGSEWADDLDFERPN